MNKRKSIKSFIERHIHHDDILISEYGYKKLSDIVIKEYEKKKDTLKDDKDIVNCILQKCTELNVLVSDQKRRPPSRLSL